MLAVKLLLHKGEAIVRMKELNMTIDVILKVDTMELPENCIIILSQRKAKVAERPAFAETKIVTHQG